MDTKRRSIGWLACALIVGVIALAASRAPAAGYTWTAGGSSDYWYDVDNWSPTGVPSGTDVTFAAAGTQALLGSARYVELITLNTPFEIAGTQTGRHLTIRAGVTSTAAGTSTIRVAEAYINVDDGTTWDIAAGSKVVCLTGGDANAYGGFRFADGTLTKTGEGTLAVGGGGWRNWDTQHGLWSILGGTVELTPHPDSTSAGSAGIGGVQGTGTLAVSRRLHLSEDNFRSTDYTFEGYLEVSEVAWSGASGSLNKYAPNTMTLSGTNGRIELLPGTHDDVYVEAGTLKLDNTAVSRDNRLGSSALTIDPYLYGGTLALVGNDTVDVIEEHLDAVLCREGLGTISVTHGASASATISCASLNSNNSNRGMFLVTGNDLGAETGPGSYVLFSSAPSLDDGMMVGWTRANDEFATYDAARGVMPLDATGRPGSVEGAAASDNVLVTSAQVTLTGTSTTVNSLKIDGAYPLDLGGSMLTIDTGGLIQTGAANSISNGTLDADRLYVQTATDLTISADISGTSITKIGAGKLVLSGSSLPGTVYWADGDLEIDGSGSITVEGGDIANRTADLYISGGCTVELNSSDSSKAAYGDVYVDASTLQFDNSGDFGGYGKTVLTNGAVLEATDRASTGGIVSMAGGSRFVFGGSGSSSWDNRETMYEIVDTGEIRNNTGGSRWMCNMTGAGRLIKTGADEIYLYSGDKNGFTGVFEVAEGSVRCSPGYFPANASGVHVRSGATLEFASWSASHTVAGDVSGEGTFWMHDSGGAGRLTVSGGACRPGDSGVGTLNVNGKNMRFTQNGGGQNAALEIEFSDTATHDVLNVTGLVDGMAACDVVFKLATPSLAFDSRGGLSGTFVTAGSLGTGTFAATRVEVPAPLNPAVAAQDVADHYQIDSVADLGYDATGVALAASAPWAGHDGDANLDDVVDVFDLAVLANNYNVIGAQDWTTADYDCSGVVDVFDLAALANNYGWVGGGGGGGDPVPEPATLGLIALGALAVIRRRRR